MQKEDFLDYERILLVKPEVFMYRIPPRTSNRGYRYFENYHFFSDLNVSSNRQKQTNQERASGISRSPTGTVVFESFRIATSAASNSRTRIQVRFVLDEYTSITVKSSSSERQLTTICRFKFDFCGFWTWACFYFEVPLRDHHKLESNICVVSL